MMEVVSLWLLMPVILTSPGLTTVFCATTVVGPACRGASGCSLEAVTGSACTVWLPGCGPPDEAPIATDEGGLDGGMIAPGRVRERARKGPLLKSQTQWPKEFGSGEGDEVPTGRVARGRCRWRGISPKGRPV